jgi:hypothetical protein
MACYLLNIPLPEGTEGKPIMPVIRRDELMYETDTVGK